MHICQNIYFCHHLNNIIVLHICIPQEYNLKPQINFNYSSQTCSHSGSLSRFGISEACSNLVATWAASTKRRPILANGYSSKKLYQSWIFKSILLPTVTTDAYATASAANKTWIFKSAKWQQSFCDASDLADDSKVIPGSPLLF